jgi:hypothetical protein
MDLLFHLGHRLDVNLLLVLGAESKLHNAILDSKNGVITTDARVQTGPKLCTPLPNYDSTRTDSLSREALHT